MTPKQRSYLLALCPSMRPHVAAMSASTAHAVLATLKQYHEGTMEPRAVRAHLVGLMHDWSGDLPAPRGTKQADAPQPTPQPLPDAPKPAPTPDPDDADHIPDDTPAPTDPSAALPQLVKDAARALARQAPYLDQEARSRLAGQVVDHQTATVGLMVAVAVRAALAAHAAEQAAQPAASTYAAPAPASAEYQQPAHWGNACAVLDASLNLLLTGPAGNGKSRFAREYAAARNIPYTYISFSGGLSLTALIGGNQLVIDDQGQQVSRYVPTAWIAAIQQPGVSALEELTTADPEVSLWLNAVLEADTRTAQTPDGIITVHPEHRFVALSNGTGRSESRAYAAAARQDESLLNRFVAIATDYEASVDRAVLGHLPADAADYLTTTVGTLRRQLAGAGITLDLGPRQLRAAAALITQGLPRRTAAELALIGHLTHAERSRAGIALED